MEDEGVSSPSEFASHLPTAPSENVHLKVLVPSIAAGAIIGRGGEAIAQIQKETDAKVKMAKQNDFYPGTTERVCLIVGAIEGVIAVHNYIMTHIREKRDSFAISSGNANGAQCMAYSPHEIRQHGDRSQQVKILVPNTTAGMIIGKSGAYIKEIKQKSGAFIQISQKAKDANLLERCITIAGDLEQCNRAMEMIVLKIAEDPQSSSCPNTSYAEVSGPIASAFPTGSPYAQRTPVMATTTNVTNTGNGLGGALAVTTPLSLGTALLAPSVSAISPPAHYLTLQGPSAPTFLLNNPMGNFNSGLKLLSPSENVTFGSSASSMGTGIPVSGSGLSIGVNMANLTALSGQPQQQVFGDMYVPNSMGSATNSIFAYNPTHTIYSTRPTLASPIALSPSQQFHHHSQQQQQQAQQHNQPTFSAFTGPTGSLFGGFPSSNLPGFPGLSYSLPSQKPLPTSLMPIHQETIKRDIQIPDSFVAIVAEAQSEMQRKYGVSIRIHHYQPSTAASSMDVNSSGEEKNRLITISGTAQGVQGAYQRVHELLNYQTHSSSSTNVADVASHKRDTNVTVTTTNSSL